MAGKGKLPRGHYKRAQPLRKGDVIQVIAPSSPFSRKNLETSLRWIQRRGYGVFLQKTIFSRQEYLAGSDSRRSQEFQRAWTDKSVQAIFCARGGYGSMRLDLARPFRGGRVAPKIFVGLSDVTVLLNYLAKSLGIVTIHGPMLAGPSFLKLSAKKKDGLFQCLEHEVSQSLKAPKDYDVLRSGTARGKLWGGNLSMVVATLGTPYEVPFERAILFLEDVNEPKYKLDRMLAQLALAGKLKTIRALVWGEVTDERGKLHGREWMKQLSARHLGKGKIPVLVGVRSGHGRNEAWLPIGGECSIEAKGKRLLLSPLVKEE